jgi:hypothetical protein
LAQLLVLPDVETLDLRVGLHDETRGVDRARIPGDGGGLLGILEPLGVSGTDGVATLGHRILAVAGDRRLHRFDQRR